jgi:hypothetical protein
MQLVSILGINNFTQLFARAESTFQQLFFNLAAVKVLSVCSCKTSSCIAYFPAQLWFAAGQTASSRSLFSSYFQSRFNRSWTTSAFALLLRCSVPSRCSKSFTYDTTLCFMFAHTFQTFYR